MTTDPAAIAAAPAAYSVRRALLPAGAANGVAPECGRDGRWTAWP